jgi:hypothetical protein
VSQAFSGIPPTAYWIFFSALALIVITLAIATHEGGAELAARRGGRIIHALSAGSHVISHTAILALITACMIALGWAIKNNPLDPDPIMFGRVPLLYAVEAVELVVLATFGY